MEGHTEKARAYVARERRLRVFEHSEHPEAGISTPVRLGSSVRS